MTRDTEPGERDVEAPDGRAKRGVVAFDNSGTVSDVVVETVGFTDDADFDRPVPAVREDRPTALVNVAVAGPSIPDTDAPLGTVLAEAGEPLHLALSNGETTVEEARQGAFADIVAPSRPLFEATQRLRERVTREHGHEDPLIGIQLCVEPGTGTIHRGFAYASVPREEAREVVAAVRDRGFDVHLVSGDARHVLESVAERVGVRVANVHAHQSPEDKAETISALRDRSDGPVVMVGDYVNDRPAFERADRAVLVCPGTDPDPDLARRVDAVAGSLSEVLTRL